MRPPHLPKLGETTAFYVSHLSTSMNSYERKKHFFINETAIELTGQTFATLVTLYFNFYNSVTPKPADGWQDQPKYCYKYTTLCLAVVFDLLSSYFSSLAD